MRILAAVLLLSLLGGCAGGDVVMRNPRTGATATCHNSASGLDPWSQADACVGHYEAAGWVRATAP